VSIKRKFRISKKKTEQNALALRNWLNRIDNKAYRTGAIIEISAGRLPFEIASIIEDLTGGDQHIGETCQAANTTGREWQDRVLKSNGIHRIV
jgi:hypothetical protein